MTAPGPAPPRGLLVALIAPHDDVTTLIADHLADDPAVGEIHVLEQPLSVQEGAAMRYDLLGGYFDAVVYRPPVRRGAPDLADAAAALAACARARPGRVVLLASAAVWEPRHDHLGMVAEEAPAPRPVNGIARAWAELEALAARHLSAVAVPLVVLRLAPLASAAADHVHARLLSRRLAPTIAGHDPPVQLLAPSDLAAALNRALAAPPPRGARTYHVAPAGAVPLRRALRHAGVHRLPLPHALQRLVRPAAADSLAYARYPATVSGARAERELGFVPAKTSAEAVREAWGGRGGDSEPLRYDDFGLDRDYIAAYGRTLFRFLHRWYWRIEVRGLENVPAGPAVLAGVHRGFMPWDGVMALHTLVEEVGRVPRFLVHPSLVKFPFLANYITKLGGIVACNENADWVLGRGELLGMFPEGIRGAFTMYRDAYRLGRFGRDEFVRMALRWSVPIVPFVTVGSAEIFPILGRIDWPWFRRLTEWPFLPLTPTFPLLPVPLPSKWHTRFLAPIELAGRYPPAAADDPAVVREVSREVRARMQEALAAMLARRRSIFFGSVFTGEEAR